MKKGVGSFGNQPPLFFWRLADVDRADLNRPLGRNINPRPRMGGDTHDDSPFLVISVSIHAPAWGATSPLG
ncbi:hypothetical cytosolic protein [Syntrophus aciditrophicus SB]|uniref:Hypothetical cytosolic protein n=1 Tax=Syntrophus aciditrophicus (strain SB) TaxID=56780 RepID=Q2LWZ9_SYNAS|nr:hypothetical cytosolic protein [Syntrophus aciditrophicus SB]